MPGAWRWLEDYYYTTAEYRIGCPPNRKCRIGSGIFFNGIPRGSERDFSGDTGITVWGIGSSHIRIEDGVDPARIGFFQKSNSARAIYSSPSLTDAIPK